MPVVGYLWQGTCVQVRAKVRLAGRGSGYSGQHLTTPRDDRGASVESSDAPRPPPPSPTWLPLLLSRPPLLATLCDHACCRRGASPAWPEEGRGVVLEGVLKGVVKGGKGLICKREVVGLLFRLSSERI